jgi:hypothetical protein
MQTKVQKRGDCLGAGTDVSITAKDGELALRASVPSQLRLEDLLSGIVPNNSMQGGVPAPPTEGYDRDSKSRGTQAAQLFVEEIST